MYSSPTAQLSIRLWYRFRLMVTPNTIVQLHSSTRVWFHSRWEIKAYGDGIPANGQAVPVGGAMAKMNC